MDNLINNFHFIRPFYLLALIPVLGVFFLLLQGYRKRSQWTNLIDPKLLPYLMDGKITKAQKFPLYCLLVSWVLACFALAGPSWEKKALPIQKDLSAMVILWDMSPSMEATDLAPSRLVRSRLKLIDLLNARKEGLTALIVYAGDAHVVTPLTDDTKTIKSLLPGLRPEVLPEAGSNPERAFEMAHQLLKDGGVSKGNILFVTDGIAEDALNSLWASASESRHKVAVWGFGTAEGAPIPLADGGFARNRLGEIVVAKLDSDLLAEAAVKMGGAYIPYTNNADDLENIQYFGFGVTGQGESLSQKNADQDKLSEQWLEQGHWLVLLFLPLAALVFRRGWFFCLVCGLGLGLVPDQSQAFSWDDLWKTRDQQGRALLESGQAAEAAEKFDDPKWKAFAKYKAREFEQAEALFSAQDDALSHYNRGNALTQEGAYDDAITAYDQALMLQDDFADARHNRAIAEALKKLQEQQDQQQQNQNQDQQQDGEQQKQDGEGQQSEQQEGQQQDGEQSEEQNSQQGQDSQDQSNQDQGGASADESESDPQEAAQQSSEEQQEALKEHYEQGRDQENAESSESEEEKTQSQLADEQTEAQEGELDQDQEGNTVMTIMTDEQKEQQQALEQWLRKVPDDPSGLLRNKFKYENQARRRDFTSRRPRDPDASDDQRW